MRCYLALIAYTAYMYVRFDCNEWVRYPESCYKFGGSLLVPCSPSQQVSCLYYLVLQPTRKSEKKTLELVVRTL